MSERTEEEIRERLSAVRNDRRHPSRLGYADVAVNAPRALEQMGLSREERVLEWILGDREELPLTDSEEAQHG